MYVHNLHCLLMFSLADMLELRSVYCSLCAPTMSNTFVCHIHGLVLFSISFCPYHSTEICQRTFPSLTLPAMKDTLKFCFENVCMHL